MSFQTVASMVLLPGVASAGGILHGLGGGSKGDGRPPAPTLAAEVGLDHVPELLREIERWRAVLWARLTIRGRSPKRLPTGTANAKADRHCGRGSHRLSALRSRMQFRTWWALYGALGRSRHPCLALWPSFCRRDVSFSPVPRAR